MADGFEDVAKLAADLGKAGAGAVGKAAIVVRKAATDIERDAKILAPVDTGNLRNSIGAVVRGLRAEVGPTAEYGVYVEHGTSRMGPQPYMGPAAERHTAPFELAMRKVGEINL